MDEHCIICGNTDCRLDTDGWCTAHGWDCAGYHQNLREQLARLNAA